MGIKIENRKGDCVEFGVMSIPNRKSKALYLMRGCNTDILAYFTSDDNAERFERALGYAIEIITKKEASK